MSEDGSKVSFKIFLSTLGMQSYIALGLLENPATNAKEINLSQAEYMRDLIQLIHDKTKGNLNDAEQDMITALSKDVAEHLARITSSS